MTIRSEGPGDAPGIRAVLEAAFPTSVEADLVDRLRAACPEQVSLVAVEADRIVGHILFTPVTLDAVPAVDGGVGLAPMAVRPEHQSQGIGSALVRAGVYRLRASGCPFVIVVGHPPYYSRFGFVPASRYGVRSQWDRMPDEAFVILVLDPAAAPRLQGVARYRQEFDDLE